MAIYKDKNGTYLLSISYRDNEGNVKTKKKRGFRTKREALNYEVTLRSEINPSSDASMTYSDLFDAYIQNKKASANKQTIEEKIYMANNFWSELFDIKVKNIRARDYLKVWTGIANSDYSRNYKNKAITILKSVSKFGNTYFELPDHSKTLERIPKSAKDVTEFLVWTPEEFSQFITNVESPIMHAYFTFLFKTGARRSEAMGLLKTDVIGNRVTINKSIRHHVNGHRPLKTASSIRTITIDEHLLNLLKPLLERPGEFLFGDNASLAISTIQREFKKAIKLSGVKEIRLHDLRHSHASYLISKNVNIVAVSKRLGHEDINTTLSVYTHLLRESEDYLVNVLNNI